MAPKRARTTCTVVEKNWKGVLGHMRFRSSCDDWRTLENAFEAIRPKIEEVMEAKLRKKGIVKYTLSADFQASHPEHGISKKGDANAFHTEKLDDYRVVRKADIGRVIDSLFDNVRERIENLAARSSGWSIDFFKNFDLNAHKYTAIRGAGASYLPCPVLGYYVVNMFDPDMLNDRCGVTPEMKGQEDCFKYSILGALGYPSNGFGKNEDGSTWGRERSQCHKLLLDTYKTDDPDVFLLPKNRRITFKGIKWPMDYSQLENWERTNNTPVACWSLGLTASEIDTLKPTQDKLILQKRPTKATLSPRIQFERHSPIAGVEDMHEPIPLLRIYTITDDDTMNDNGHFAFIKDLDGLLKSGDSQSKLYMCKICNMPHANAASLEAHAEKGKCLTTRKNFGEPTLRFTNHKNQQVNPFVVYAVMSTAPNAYGRIACLRIDAVFESILNSHVTLGATHGSSIESFSSVADFITWLQAKLALILPMIKNPSKRPYPRLSDAEKEEYRATHIDCELGPCALCGISLRTSTQQKDLHHSHWTNEIYGYTHHKPCNLNANFKYWTLPVFFGGDWASTSQVLFRTIAEANDVTKKFDVVASSPNNITTMTYDQIRFLNSRAHLDEDLDVLVSSSNVAKGVNDAMTLRNVFEEYRIDRRARNGGLDPAFYWTFASYAFDNLFRHSRANVALFTRAQSDMLDVALSTMRGANNFVCQRLSRANIPSMPDYDPSLPMKGIFYEDINSSYPKQMRGYLPYNGYSWADAPSLDVLRTIALNAKSGCFVQINVAAVIDKKLQDYLSDFPLFATKKVPTVSPIAATALGRSGSRACETLVADFEAKQGLWCHYAEVQLGLELGYGIEIVGKALCFNQGPWMRSYIDNCVAERQSAKTPFESDLSKMSMNAPSGRCGQRSDLYRDFVIARTEAQFLRAVALPLFQNAHCFDDNDITEGEIDISDQPLLVESAKAVPKFDKPYLVAATILALGRVAHAHHWYNNIKRLNPSAKLIYVHTDSWIYSVEGKLIRAPSMYDFSNYPSDHPLYDATTKRVPGLVKDETSGRDIAEVVVVGRNQYSILMADGSPLKVALAGVPSEAVDAKHTDLKAAVMQSTPFNVSWTQTVRRDHAAYQETITRTVLTGTDTSRHLQKDGLTCLPYGHYLCD